METNWYTILQRQRIWMDRHDDSITKLLSVEQMASTTKILYVLTKQLYWFYGKQNWSQKLLLIKLNQFEKRKKKTDDYYEFFYKWIFLIQTKTGTKYPIVFTPKPRPHILHYHHILLLHPRIRPHHMHRPLLLFHYYRTNHHYDHEYEYLQ